MKSAAAEAWNCERAPRFWPTPPQAQQRSQPQTEPRTPSRGAYPLLRPGARGEAVWAMQQRLVAWLNSVGESAQASRFLQRCEAARRSCGVGVYGPETMRVMERFQRANHLTPDLVVGAKTWPRLLGRPVPAPERVVAPIHPVVRSKYLAIVNTVTDNYRATGRRPGADLETWRSLLVQYRWPLTAINDALRVIAYESGGNQFCVAGKDVGLFQVNFTAWRVHYTIGSWDDWVSVMWNPENNVMAALTIWKGNGQRFKGQWHVTKPGRKGADIR